MRGEDRQQQEMFLYASLEELVPANHPLRPIRAMVDEALWKLDATFDELYGEGGRPSIAPERLLRAQLLMLLYSIRSERMLVEQLRYNLLFRWFVGLGMNEEVWHATVFRKKRDRLLEGEVAREFFGAIVRMAKRRGNGNGQVGRNREWDWRGQRRRHETHASTTDPEARLWRKSQTAEAKLCYLGHVLTENRHGLVVNVRVTQAHGRAEREAAVEMAEEIPGGTRRHEGYGLSQRARKRVEEFFGWMKTVAGLRKVRWRGKEKVRWMVTLAAAAYNLVRMRNLMAATA